MPLHNGKLTCETCHQSSLQLSAGCLGTEGSKKNRHFFRRKDISRNEYCFLCHVEESYLRLNPHQQIDEQGRIREDTCLGYHWGK